MLDKTFDSVVRYNKARVEKIPDFFFFLTSHNIIFHCSITKNKFEIAIWKKNLISFNRLHMFTCLCNTSRKQLCEQTGIFLSKFPVVLIQWFPNFSGARTTLIILVLRESQNIDLYWDWRTTWANLANHWWSA
jgi:hypothetical protein